MALTARGLPASRPPTVKDVARLAGVSASTVSNVLHNHPYVAAEKRAAVEAAIVEIGYRPSRAGRALRKGHSDVLALALPDLRSPYYAELAHSVNREARRQGFTLLVDETGGMPDRERAIVQGYPGQGIEGVIFCPVSTPAEELEGLGGEAPVTLLGEHGVPEGCDRISIDSVTSAREATAHLLSSGRRRFAFIGHQPDRAVGPGPLRLAGVRAELSASGVDLDESLVLAVSQYSREEGQRAAERITRRRGEVDAVICAADLLAIGAMRALRVEGFSIPRDVAILGWDDSPEGQFSSPSLTTVKHDLEAIAEHAVRSLLSRIADPDTSPRHYVARHELVIRESTLH